MNLDPSATRPEPPPDQVPLSKLPDFDPRTAELTVADVARAFALVEGPARAKRLELVIDTGTVPAQLVVLDPSLTDAVRAALPAGDSKAWRLAVKRGRDGRDAPGQAWSKVRLYP